MFCSELVVENNLCLSDTCIIFYPRPMLLMTSCESLSTEPAKLKVLVQVRYKTNLPGKPRARFVNSTDLNCLIHGLRPHTYYEIAVRVVQEKRRSEWSMTETATTKESSRFCSCACLNFDGPLGFAAALPRRYRRICQNSSSVLALVPAIRFVYGAEFSLISTHSVYFANSFILFCVEKFAVLILKSSSSILCRTRNAANRSERRSLRRFAHSCPAQLATT